MPRLVVLVLIAINVLYFGWSHWAVADKPVLTAVASAGQQGKKKPNAAPPPPCATLGPFHDESLAEQAVKQLKAAGLRTQHRATSEDISDGWWVYVTNDNAAMQTRTLDTLRRTGMRDAFPMPDDPEFRVSVGLFSEEPRARDRATRLKRLQLQAVVKERRKQQPVIWLDLPGVAREALGNGRLDATSLPLDTLRIEACPVATEKPAPAAPAAQPEQPAPANDAADADKTGKSGVASFTGARETDSPRV